jgi:type III secretion protein T
VFDLSYEGIKKSVLMLGLIQARLMPLLLLLPFMSRNLVPRTIVFGVAAGIGLIVLPILPESLVVRADMSLVFIVAKEAFVGLLVGFVCAIPFWVMEAVGFIVDNQRGASMAATINPMTGHDTSPIGMLLNMAFITFFFAIGGLALLLDLIYQSYRLWPPDRFWPVLDLREAGLLIDQVNRLVLLALLLAAPPLVIMFMAELGLALVSRFAPQLQVFFLAMPIKSALGIFVLVIYSATLFEFGADQLREIRGWSGRLDAILGGASTR